MEDAHHVPKWGKLMPLFVSIAGIGLAVVIYGRMPFLADKIANTFPAIYRLFYHKWYFDELYDKAFVLPAVRWGQFFWLRGDKAVIDVLVLTALAPWWCALRHFVAVCNRAMCFIMRLPC